jgi:hypothetical protein
VWKAGNRLCYHVLGTGSRPCPLKCSDCESVLVCQESQLPWRAPQTFTLDLGEIKDAVTNTLQVRVQTTPLLLYPRVLLQSVEGKRFVASFVLCKTPGPPPDIHKNE